MNRFAFGDNWLSYLEKSLSEERMAIAKDALCVFLDLDTLEGKTFLDVGSGSGVHSLAAFHLGAKAIISFDYDAQSVAATEYLRTRVGSPEHWRVFQGDVLDASLVDTLRADIVYSWGVLHHTGQMWTAIRNAAAMVNPGGLFGIAIYNKVERSRFGGTSETWRKIKRFYVTGPGWRKWLIEWGYITWQTMRMLRYGINPIKERRRPRRRGMDWRHDVRDWVGGYPFEFASVDEVVTFCTKELGLISIKVLPRNGHACNEFVFEKPRQ